jgi:hypothetical protein
MPRPDPLITARSTRRTAAFAYLVTMIIVFAYRQCQELKVFAAAW